MDYKKWAERAWLFAIVLQAAALLAAVILWT